MKASEAYQVQRTRFMLWLEKHDLHDISPLYDNGVDLHKLLSLCVVEHTKNNLALHAIWFLEKYVIAHPADLSQSFHFLVTNRLKISIEGAQRILGNIYMHALKNSAGNTTEEQDEELINAGFEWLTTPDKPIAVVANAIELLYILSLRHEWIKEALEAEISLLLERGTTPAIRSRGQKVLKLLHRNPKR